MAKKNENISLDEILDGDMPVDQEINLGDSVVDEAEGEFKLPEAPEETAKTEVSAKELTDLEKEIEDGKAQVESDIRARSAATPPTMEECFELIPELKDMPDEDRRTYLLAEMVKTKLNFNSVDAAELLAVQLSKFRAI